MPLQSKDSSTKRDDDSRTDPRAQKAGKNYPTDVEEKAAFPQADELMSEKPKAVDNLSAICPCGHNSLIHGVGLGGSNNWGACEIKGCNCSGFSQKPGQGQSWAFNANQRSSRPG